MLAPSDDNMLMSGVFKDLDINPDMRLTITEYSKTPFYCPPIHRQTCIPS
jgi:hypothetical protein